MSQQVTSLENYYSARASEYEITSSYACRENAARMGPLKARHQLALEGHDVLEVACGPGYWTEAVAVTSRSIVATDRDPTLVSMVRNRLAANINVRCEVADAYTLDGIRGPFTAAFANFWWSHIPKSRIATFLTTLHSRLEPGSLVMLMDDLPYFSDKRRYDEEGNLLEERVLTNGDAFEIIKNFPTESELLRALEGRADSIIYRQFSADNVWSIRYQIK